MDLKRFEVREPRGDAKPADFSTGGARTIASGQSPPWFLQYIATIMPIAKKIHSYRKILRIRITWPSECALLYTLAVYKFRHHYEN